MINYQPSAKQRGFTLIELLIVMAIIGVLSALLMSNFVGIRQRARDGQRKSDLRQMQAALELYRADNGSYPDTASFPSSLNAGKCGTAVAFISGLTTYMKTVPCDPLTNTTSYQYFGDTSTYCLRACLENDNDSQKSVGTASCSTLADCPNSNNFSVENP